MRNHASFKTSSNSAISKTIALLMSAALLASTFALSVTAQSMDASKKSDARARLARLSDNQRILHVLNRLGFGARPGDVERVKAMGLENYINQQLNPGGIADLTLEAKLKDKNLPTLAMTTAELYEKYPQPGQLLKQLDRRGDLPSGLAAARENRVKGGANAAPTSDANAPQMTTPAPSEAMPGDPKNSAPAVTNNPADLNPQNNEAYRKAIRDYYQQNGLQPPQRITGELQASRILRAVYSERQLQEVMVDFWTNHFNVFAGKGADRWLLTSYDRDTIRPNSLGKFSDLLKATAQSPAMLFYLDNFQSVSPNAQLANGNGGRRLQQAGRAQVGRDPILDMLRDRRRNAQQMGRNPNVGEQGPNKPQAQPAPKRQKRGINENYARELMELHTLGVDGGYTQKDVQEVARCFTGWTIFAPRGAGVAAAAIMGDQARENAGKFYFAPRMHDDGEKTVLGHKIPAGGGVNDGLMVLDMLTHQQATARFIATKLVRHFVMDNPPAALVDRVAAAFTKSDGDIRETLKAIFFSPEFNSAEAYRAKIKRPFELTISAIRTLGAETNGGPQLHQWIARMGEPLYGFQTPNGYSDVAENWVNTGALLERLNFGLALASNRIPGTRVNLRQFVGDSSADASADKAKIMDRFLGVIVAGEISARTKETLLKQLDEEITLPPPQKVADQEVAGMAAGFPDGPRAAPRPGPQATITDPVTKIVGLILGTPEFQRQ
ncbi:MAG: DUF1800 domain-containing protein [Acidobacteriota bacterium]|nr:DUF1800 domain-containing protein [Acidobacteriota bacterium]